MPIKRFLEFKSGQERQSRGCGAEQMGQFPQPLPTVEWEEMSASLALVRVQCQRQRRSRPSRCSTQGPSLFQPLEGPLVTRSGSTLTNEQAGCAGPIGRKEKGNSRHLGWHPGFSRDLRNLRKSSFPEEMKQFQLCQPLSRENTVIGLMWVLQGGGGKAETALHRGCMEGVAPRKRGNACSTPPGTTGLSQAAA